MSKIRISFSFFFVLLRWYCVSYCKALGGVEELPAARLGSWKVDKFKDLASLVKMSFKLRGYIGAFGCV